MQIIGATLPATNFQLFQARGASFKCNSCPLNTSVNTTQTSNIKTLSSSSTEKTKKHISNLEKLLQKESSQLANSNVVFQESSDGSLESRGSRNFLEGLKLASIWPEMKSAEDLSPRHLNRLKRLLSSKSVEYSPRNNLCSRWREYHGSNNWSGLLDPLDENLRRELVKYGEFIQAAYHCFNSNPAMSTYDCRHVALPDRSYRVTKNLHATSSVGLPKWVDDLGWMTQRTSCIGYVAVCDDRNEIQRMGRRDIVISLRGTATCLEWAENFRDLLVHNDDSAAKVQCGFLSLYKTAGDGVPSLAESVVNEVQRLMEQYKGEALSITVTGHSLGAALALLVADDLSTCAPTAPPVAVFSFGGPRVGNRGFADRLSANNVKVLRIVNNQDVITRVPGMFVSETLDKKLRETGGGRVQEILDYKMPWAYSHVGTEFRVDTRMSPFLKPNADIACCHDLEAYLHLVDGFSASDSPFRPNAKRSLVRLLNEQSSNVKKLYTSKVKDLSLNLDREHNFHTSSCLPSPSS